MRGYFVKMWMRKCKSTHKTLHPVGIRRQSHAENMDHLKRRSNVELRLHNISPIIAQQDWQRASGTEMGVRAQQLMVLHYEVYHSGWRPTKETTTVEFLCLPQCVPNVDQWARSILLWTTVNVMKRNGNNVEVETETEERWHLFMLSFLGFSEHKTASFLHITIICLHSCSQK